MSDARFSPGQLVLHRLFDYRGVVVDVDATFRLSDEWYDRVARTRPPRDQPWYHVLVHDAEHMTYVAERHLAPDESADPVTHPQVQEYFAEFRDGHYRTRQALN